MSQTTDTTDLEAERDLVLREVWRAKDALSAARGHSVDKLFADLRKREKESGHRVVNLQEQPEMPANEPAKGKPARTATWCSKKSGASKPRFRRPTATA